MSAIDRAIKIFFVLYIVVLVLNIMTAVFLNVSGLEACAQKHNVYKCELVAVPMKGESNQ